MRELDPLLKTCFADLCARYRASMATFRPCRPSGEVVEQNLVTAFLFSCLQHAPKGHWGVEIPFIGNQSMRLHRADSKLSSITITKLREAPWQNHIDAFFYHDGTLYLIEAKRDYPALTFVQKVKTDYERLLSFELAMSFQLMLHRDVYDRTWGPIQAVKGLLLADTWRPTNQVLWQDAHYQTRKSRTAVDLAWLKNLRRDSHDLEIGSNATSESYHLLIAQTDDLTATKRIINERL